MGIWTTVANYRHMWHRWMLLIPDPLAGGAGGAGLKPTRSVCESNGMGLFSGRELVSLTHWAWACSFKMALVGFRLHQVLQPPTWIPKLPQGTFVCGWNPNYCCYGEYNQETTAYSAILLIHAEYFIIFLYYLVSYRIKPERIIQDFTFSFT